MNYEYNNLTQAQKDAVDAMMYHEKILLKQKGFWTYKECPFKQAKNGAETFEIPAWSCRITTLRVLAKKNIVKLDEVNGICKLQ